jgi:hypothetical protein
VDAAFLTPEERQALPGMQGLDRLTN